MKRWSQMLARAGVAAVMVVALLVVAAGQPAQPLAAQAACNWTGVYDTGRYGELRLVQHGVNVAGVYQYYDGDLLLQGSLTGTISGNSLSGTWQQSPASFSPNDFGTFQLQMNASCTAFTGTYRNTPPTNPNADSDGEWNGMRL
jgi:hypothetical protein